MMIDKEKVRELVIALSKFDVQDYAVGFAKEWLEQNLPSPQVVGLSDEQLISFARQVFSQEYQQQGLIYCYHDWAKRQNFEESEVTKLEKETAEMQIAYIDLQRYSSEIKKELEQLKSQFKPDWITAPAEATLYQAIGNFYRDKHSERLLTVELYTEQRPNKIHKAIAWGLGNKVVSGVEYPKVKPFVVDWEHAPSDAVEYAVIEYYKAKEGHNCHVKTLHYEQRPQPPAPKVEIGQVWRSDMEEVRVIEFGRRIDGEETVCFKDVDTDCIKQLATSYFLEKFERVGGE